MKKFLLYLFFISPMLLTAQTVTWDGGAGTDSWMDAMNWSTDAIPTMSQDVDLDGNTVVLGASTQVQRVYAGGSSDLTINSGVTLTIDGFAGGDEGLEVQGSATLTNNGTISIANISGSGADGLYVKGTCTNNGSINISNISQHGVYCQGGSFTNAASGVITITDVLGDYFYADDNGGTGSNPMNFGTITITVTTGDDGVYVNDNSTFNNSGMLDISLGAGASGGDEAIFAEDGGTFNNNSGGVVTINSSQDQGIQTKLNGVINNNMGGTINIDAVDNDQIWLDATTSFTNGGTLNLTNAVDVGLYITDASTFTNTATGIVNVTNATDHGIYVQGNTLATASFENSGTVTVTGGGASSDGLRLNTGGSFTNNAGAFLNLVNTGADGIQCDGNTTLNNSGTISVDGTSSAASGAEEALELINGSTFNNNSGGVYIVANCADDGIEVNNGAVVNNDGAIRIDGSAGEDIETFSGFTFNNTSNATFAPGSSPGDFEVKGDLDLGTSTTTFEINGLVATTEYDQILNFISTNTLTVSNATMHLDWGSFVPSEDDCFKVVDGSGLVGGQFATVTSSNADIAFTVSYPGTEVIVCIDAPLPVELVNFSGAKTERGSALSWTTASEENNEGFEIERSNNGSDWTKIGYVRGNGTSSTLMQYSFLDRRPSVGTNYYRLKQNDFDGQFEYSKTIILNYKTGKGEATFYPNPATEMVTYVGVAATLTFYDLHGRVIMQTNTQGENANIDISDLKAGVYIIEISGDHTEGTFKRFIKK